jgi:hypothetical protein
MLPQIVTPGHMQTTQPNSLCNGKVPLIIALCLIAACRTATVQQHQPEHPSAEAATETTVAAPIPLPSQRTFCSYCAMSGTLALRTPELSAEGTFRIILAGRDSLNGTIYGPLGIVAARAYCTPDETLIFDALSQKAYQLLFPLRETTVFAIEREELLALLRCEVPFDPGSYLPAGERTRDSSVLYVHRDTAFVDIAQISARGELRAYQRKSLDNQLLAAIEYGTYRTWDNQHYPDRIRIVAPTHNVELVLTPEDITEHPKPSPFRFRLPSSIPRTVIK